METLNKNQTIEYEVKSKIPDQDGWSIKDLNEIEQKNLFGFFDLLLKVDKRVNPQMYKNDLKK